MRDAHPISMARHIKAQPYPLRTLVYVQHMWQARSKVMGPKQLLNDEEDARVANVPAVLSLNGRVDYVLESQCRANASNTMWTRQSMTRVQVPMAEPRGCSVWHAG